MRYRNIERNRNLKTLLIITKLINKMDTVQRFHLGTFDFWAVLWRFFFSPFTGHFWDGLGAQLNKPEIENIKIWRKRVYLVLDNINRKIKFGLSHFEWSNSPFLGGNFLVGNSHKIYWVHKFQFGSVYCKLRFSTVNSNFGVYITN